MHIATKFSLTMIVFGVLIQSASATINPVDANLVSGHFPAKTYVGNSYTAVYQMISNYPGTMPGPLQILTPGLSDEFYVTNQCSNKKLSQYEQCTVTVTLTPTSTGVKSAQLTMKYGNTKIKLPTLSTTSIHGGTSWVGLLGVDYQPNHYTPVNNQFNQHDDFIVGNANGTDSTWPAGTPITNVYEELKQLKASGYNTVRAYQTYDYIWVDIINQANALGMKVIYEAVIPQTGSQVDISAATSLLETIINDVTPAVFNKTVVLVFSGHENYCGTCGPGGGSNVQYLLNAINSLKAVPGNQAPVGFAFLGPDLIAPPSNDITTLVNAQSPGAPIAGDIYPFQWGVPVAQSVETISSSSAINSIGWDYYQMQQQSYYSAGRPILMAETGWATAGGQPTPPYACGGIYGSGPCEPSVENEVAYFNGLIPAYINSYPLYGFVNTSTNKAGVLVFEAYDEPAKVTIGSMEDYYGVFDQNCVLKTYGSTANAIPNASFSQANYQGCNGYSDGAQLTVVGFPTYNISITQSNPVTTQAANIINSNVRASTMFPVSQMWPRYLVFSGATFTLTNTSNGNTCNGTISVGANQVITFVVSGQCNCNAQNTCFI
ncbi:MAG: hypothetical protein HYX60_03410 [Legionella longbeachae]|nr:hypothetical protein [Legionella longbeachae]